MESIGLILAVMTEGNSGKSSRCIPFIVSMACRYCSLRVLIPIEPQHCSSFLRLRNACASRWKGYFDFLPKDIPGMPMCWGLEKLCHLQGTALHDKMSGCKAMPDTFVEPPCQVPIASHHQQSCSDQLNELHVKPLRLSVTACYLKAQSSKLKVWGGRLRRNSGQWCSRSFSATPT